MSAIERRSPAMITDDRHVPRLAVIIPYYQKEAGLLRNAIDSVFAQNVVPQPLIVVIDDSSPMPAQTDLESLQSVQRRSVTVERQSNAGPGAARNRGLDRLPPHIEYVAFLDSDDVWCPGHLQRALSALDAGNDFFFSNFLDIDSPEGAFQLRGLVDPRDHKLIDAGLGTYAYALDLRGAVLRGCPIETSTVVFRKAAFSDLRFRAKFRHAYEDLMFWFEAAARSSKVAFSWPIGTRYGRGINMFRGVTQGSDASFRAVVASTIFRKSVQSLFELTVAQRESVRTKLIENRKTLAYELLYRARRRRPIPWRELRKLASGSPGEAIRLVLEVARQLSTWLLPRKNS